MPSRSSLDRHLDRISTASRPPLDRIEDEGDRIEDEGERGLTKSERAILAAGRQIAPAGAFCRRMRQGRMFPT